MAEGDYGGDEGNLGDAQEGQADVADNEGGGGGGGAWAAAVEAYASHTAAVIDAAMANAKRDKDPENFDPMGSAHKGKFDYYGGVDMDSMFGQPTDAKPAFTDVQYRDK